MWRILILFVVLPLAAAQTRGPLKVKRPPLRPATTTRTAKPAENPRIKPEPKPAPEPTAAAKKPSPPRAPGPCPEGYVAKPSSSEIDEERPKLRRGTPTEYQRDEEEEQPRGAQPDCVWSEVDVSEGGSMLVEVTHPPDWDPFIEKTRELAFTFSDTLPDYICDQKILRYAAKTRPPEWKLKDRLSTEVLFVDGRESYQNTKRNGKKMKKDPKDTGQWSSGEFGSIMQDVFATNTNAKFVYERDADIGGVKAKVYTYRVAKVSSHWDVRFGGSQIFPSYKGSVWIDRETQRVMRIEMIALRLPEDYPVNAVEMTVDYGPVEIAGKEYLLVTRAENLSCQNYSLRCSRNEIEFRNYRKFTTETSVSTTETTITFDGEEPKEEKKQK